MLEEKSYSENCNDDLLDKDDLLALYDPLPLIKFNVSCSHISFEESISCFFLNNFTYSEKKMLLSIHMKNDSCAIVLKGRRDNVIIYLNNPLFCTQKCKVVMYMQKDKLLKFEFDAEYDMCKILDNVCISIS